MIDFLLQENGKYLLQENGYKILLEQVRPRPPVIPVVKPIGGYDYERIKPLPTPPPLPPPEIRALSGWGEQVDKLEKKW